MIISGFETLAGLPIRARSERDDVAFNIGVRLNDDEDAAAKAAEWMPRLDAPARDGLERYRGVSHFTVAAEVGPFSDQRMLIVRAVRG